MDLTKLPRYTWSMSGMELDAEEGEWLNREEVFAALYDPAQPMMQGDIHASVGPSRCQYCGETIPPWAQEFHADHCKARTP